MDRKQPMELTNMCMVYKNGQVLVEEKIIGENADDDGYSFHESEIKTGTVI